MLILLSPAKTLDLTVPAHQPALTEPLLREQAKPVAAAAKRLSVRRIKDLMELSDPLAALTHARFQALDLDQSGDVAAIFAFAGDVYRGLGARTLNAEQLAFAQEHLRILSGLYGLLRPLDALQPYRLEMGRPLKVGRAADLYAYWQTRIAGLIDDAKVEVVLNLASQEYAKAARSPKLKTPVITVEFKDIQGNKARVLGLYAKHARGSLARAIIEAKITTPEAVKSLRPDGYTFVASESDATNWLFTRPQPAPVKPAGR